MQGQTRRWVIAWSFGDARLPDVRRSSPHTTQLLNMSQSLGRAAASDALRAYLPPPNTQRRSFSARRSRVKQIVQEILGALDSIFVADEPEAKGGNEDLQVTQGYSIRVRASRNSWSRSARRKTAANRPSETDTPSKTTLPNLMSCTLHFRPSEPIASESGPDEDESTVLECTWTRGHDRALYESFWGHVSRRVAERLSPDVRDEGKVQGDGGRPKRRKVDS